jgi:hypothetical protein
MSVCVRWRLELAVIRIARRAVGFGGVLTPPSRVVRTSAIDIIWIFRIEAILQELRLLLEVLFF